jgi:hypothetical protein
MPRYYFDLFENGSHQVDDAGLEFQTLDQVRQEAMEALPEIAKDQVPKDGDRQNFTVLVKDEDGKPVYTASLTFAGLWLGTEKQES